MVSRVMDGELEAELESLGELESEFESEWEEEAEGEEFLGTLARGAASLLGLSESEMEGEWEGEWEGEYESEEFFRRIGGFLRRAAPILRRVARVAAPIVGTAVGGPVGAALGRVAASALREGEFEYEMEGEYESEFEGEFEEEAAGPITQQQALAEFMAAVASQAQTEAEAEAMAGAATIASLSPADRAALNRILPHLVRGAAILTRILRSRGVTRPAVRTVPTITRRTAQILTQRAAAGQPVTKRTAGRVMASQTRQVLSRPRTCASAIHRNIRATRAVARRPAVAGTPRQRQRTLAG